MHQQSKRIDCRQFQVLTINSFWNLSLAFNKNISQILFAVDSTWHHVHVDVKDINSKIWLGRPNDYMPTQADIRLPVKSFDSDNSSRDKKRQKVIVEELFPDIVFILEQFEDLRDPTIITEK